MTEDQAEQLAEEERKIALEHRDALLDIRAIMATSSGVRFLKYLFKNLQVGTIPPMGTEGNLLMEQLGFLRAGNSVFDIACEANETVSAGILAKIRKEHNDALYVEN